MVATLGEAGRSEALVKILTEPKNALVKQYHKLSQHGSVSIWRFVRARCRPSRCKAIKPEDGRARAAFDFGTCPLLDVMYRIAQP